jgi:hypothetical protein
VLDEGECQNVAPLATILGTCMHYMYVLVYWSVVALEGVQIT